MLRDRARVPDGWSTGGEAGEVPRETVIAHAGVCKIEGALVHHTGAMASGLRSFFGRYDRT